MLPLRSAIDRSRNVDTQADRKSTRLNSSHSQISYAVFCLKKIKYLKTVVSKNNAYTYTYNYSCLCASILQITTLSNRLIDLTTYFYTSFQFAIHNANVSYL